MFPTARVSLIVGAVAALGLGTLLLRPAPATAQATGAAPTGPTKFQIDSVHSSMVFRVQHLGVAHFWGRFNKITGHYAIDPDNPAAGEFSIEIDAASIDTANAKRDEHLRSSDFFAVSEHPTITFRSKSVRKAADNLWRVNGELTLHGTTRPITAEMKLVGMKDTPQGYKSGFDTTFTIKRSDFGMTTYVQNGALGDEVMVMLALEGKRQ